MKRIAGILLYFFFFAGAAGYGQGQGAHADISTISLAVAMPKEIKGLTEEQMSILENRIKNIVSMNGLSAEGGLEGFVIYPKFDLLGKDEAPGMRTVVLERCNLSLFVRQFISNSSSNIVFSSYNKDITGSGYSESEAIANALTQIRPGDDDFQAFLDKTRARIVNYYVQNCDRIVNEAQNAANLENYEKAFALLLSIPREAGQCYSQVQQKTVEIYLKKQRQECSRFILQAKTYSAAGDFQNALEILRNVDPESVCKEDLFALLGEIGAKVDAREKQALELYEEQLRNNTELEKARYAAISEMGKAYLDAQGRRSYIVNGNGPNAPIVQDPSIPVSLPGSGYPGGMQPRPTTFPAVALPDNQPADILATTTLSPNVLFGNNIFPSFILSRASYSTSEENMKKYGDINSCIGMTISNNTTSGTLAYEIEPVEDKYFEKATGTVSFIKDQPREYFPPIPWKYDALRGIQQSTPLSIRLRLTDQTGKVKEEIVKVSFRSIRECITSFNLDGKNERTTLLAAYVNEENPQIDKLLKEGIDNKWVSGWTAYQLGPEELERQVRAIWKILSSKGIRYSDITGSTTNTNQVCYSQVVRPFCESIYNKQANCVEGSLVFASIMKKIGIRPALVMVPGHCFLAFHRTDTDDDDYIFLETTILGNIKGAPTEDAFEANYVNAIKVGGEEFQKEKGDAFLIDIATVRRQKVLSINLSEDACK